MVHNVFTMKASDKEQLHQLLTRGVEAVYPNSEALRSALEGGKKMRVYVGVDPTGPALHIGHALQLKKLREFQDFGHEVILLIGSFTAMIGDPTDKLAARQQLTAKQVMQNAATYKKQASKILRFTGKNAAKIKFNHKWLSKMSFQDVIELASHFTVQQMSERDMFERRLNEGKPVYVHEFMYPLMQGYDSVAMNVDVEIGGSDQTFNMLAGRTLMKEIKKKEKFVIALQLLTNDEGKKMSKSEGGFIAVSDTPAEMYGKIMAMADNAILPYFELVTNLSADEIEGLRLQLKAGTNPRDLKMRLAREVVTIYHDAGTAEKAEKNFASVFQNKEKPQDIADFSVGKSLNILDILVSSGLASSKSEARRLVSEGGVKLNDVAISDIAFVVDTKSLPATLQKGKRHFVRLVK